MKRPPETGKREVLLYLVSGLVSMAVSWICMFGWNAVFFQGTARPGPGQNLVLGLVNWTSGMLTAYVLNRKLVFRSRQKISAEFPRFAASRLATLVMDQVLRQVLALAGADLYVTTVVSTAAVTAANWVFSRRCVF